GSGGGMVGAGGVSRAAGGPPCFAFTQGIAACFGLTGSSRDVDVSTYVADAPPAYYAVAGVASWIRSPGAGAVYVMRLLTALMTGAFVATAITALRRAAAPALLASRLVLAVTPMAPFLGR